MFEELTLTENASESSVDIPVTKKNSDVIHCYHVYVLFVFLLAYLLNQLDRYMLSITILPVAQEIKFGNKGCLKNSSSISSRLCNATDIESCLNLVDSNNNHLCKWDYNGHGWDYLILIGPVFIFIYTFAGVFLGFVADNHNRKLLLALCLVVWSVMTILTGFVTKYWQLIVLRFLLGFSEAGCTPFATSLISDYFPRSHRATAIGIYNFGIFFGFSLSYAIGNHITLANINGQGWRWAFIISGIPGVALGLLIACAVAEPERRQQSFENTALAGLSAEASLERFKSISSLPKQHIQISNSVQHFKAAQSFHTMVTPKDATVESSHSLRQRRGHSQDKKLKASVTSWLTAGSSIDRSLKGSLMSLHKTGSSTNRQFKSGFHTSVFKTGSPTDGQRKSSSHTSLRKIGSPIDRQRKSGSLMSLLKISSSADRHRVSSYTSLHKAGSSTGRQLRSGPHTALQRFGSPIDRELRSISQTSLHLTGSSSRWQLKVSSSKQKLKAGSVVQDYRSLLKNFSSPVDKHLKETQASMLKYSSSLQNLKVTESNLNLKIFPWPQYIEGSSVDQQLSKQKKTEITVAKREPEGSPIDYAEWSKQNITLPFVQRLQIIIFAFTRLSLILLSSAGSVRHAAGYTLAYYAQLYFESSHISKEVIVSYMSWIPLVFGSLGVLGGGLISDRVVKKKKIHARVAVIIASQILASPFAACVLYLEAPYSFMSLIPALIFGEMWIAVVITVVVEVVPQEIRTSAIAVYIFIITNFGGNLPLIVPFITDAFERYNYNHHEAMRGALLIMYPGFFALSGIIFFLTMLLIRRNEQEV